MSTQMVSPRTDSSTVVLQFTEVSKEYPGVRALDGVSLSARSGEVHAVLGENGAGKSTLVGVAAGSVAPTSGAVELLGTTVGVGGENARENGLAIVHQIPALAPSLAVHEAFDLIVPERVRPAETSMANWTQACLAEQGVDVDARASISALSQREAHLVEIVAAITSRPKVLILDEPTEALGPDETAWLFDRVRTLAGAGTTVIYITHRIPEVLELAAVLTVLRDGRVVGGGRVDGFDADSIVEMIIGRSLEASFPERPELESLEAVDPVLRVDNLRGRKFQGVSLEVRPGEILGLAGVEGNGQREFLRALGGALPSVGSVSVGSVSVGKISPRNVRAAGLVFLAGDRINEALFPAMSISENVVAPALPSVARGGIVSRRSESELADRALHGLAVKAPGTYTTLSSLSGGNQQKILLGRSQVENCKVLLVEDPTQGVDAGARLEIYNSLRKMADNGVAVVVLSTDAVELSGLCDRVAVFARGRVERVLDGENVAERDITGAAVLSTGHDDHDHDHELSEGAPVKGRRPFNLVAGGDLHAVFLLLIALALAAMTRSESAAFTSRITLTELFGSASIVILVGLAQMLVVVTGGIDLSIGAVVAFSSVIVSFYADGGLGLMLFGVALAVAAGTAIGFCNGLLSSFVGIPHVIATLISSIAVVGLARILRESPGGFASPEVLDLLQWRYGFIPLLFPIAIAIAIALWFLIGRTRTGRRLRASGSDETKASKMGVNVGWTRVLAASMTGGISAIAGIFYYARTGIGDAGAGASLTLMSVTAIVIAGVNIYGGAGSALAVAAAALLLQTITSSLPFLSLSLAWQFWIQGVFVLIAAVAPAAIEARRRHLAVTVS